MSIINRQISDSIKSLIDKYPILALTGPRQSGKTTLLKNLFSDYQYVTMEDLESSSLAGNLFENLIVAEFLKKNYHQYQLREFWFWRDSNGNEIDLLTKQGNRFDIYEIKSSQTILNKFTKGLEYFTKFSNDRVNNKTLIYGGDDTHERTNYHVKSWQDI